MVLDVWVSISSSFIVVEIFDTLSLISVGETSVTKQLLRDLKEAKLKSHLAVKTFYMLSRKNVFL